MAKYPENIVLQVSSLGNLKISDSISKSKEISTYVKDVVENIRVSNMLCSFSSKDELSTELSRNLDKYEIGDTFIVNDHSGYILKEKTGSNALLEQIATKTLFSTEEDTTLSVNGSIGRAIVNINAGKNWYEVDTGIVFSDKPTVKEPDSINHVIYSETEMCYYIATTEGLYRSYNDDLSNAKRVLQDAIRSNWVSELELDCNVREIIEIGNSLYLLSVTGATHSRTVFILFNSVRNTISKTDNINGWTYNGFKLDDSQYLFSNASYGNSWGVKISVDVDSNTITRTTLGSKSDYSPSEVWSSVPSPYVEEGVSTLYETNPEYFFKPIEKFNASQYITSLSIDSDEIIFISRHRSDSDFDGSVYEPEVEPVMSSPLLKSSSKTPTQPVYYPPAWKPKPINPLRDPYPDASTWSTTKVFQMPGMFWILKSDILNGNYNNIHEIDQLSSMFIRQVNVIDNKLYICSGFDNNLYRGHYEINSSDPVGLYRITCNGTDIVFENLLNDSKITPTAYVYNNQNIKDIFYSKNADKWLFNFGGKYGSTDQNIGKIYIAKNESGTWGNLTYVGKTTGLAVYPKFKETSKFIITDQFQEDSFNAILSYIGNDQLVANLNDIRIKILKIDNQTQTVDDNGVIDIKLSSAISEVTPSIVSKKISEQLPGEFQKSLIAIDNIVSSKVEDKQYNKEFRMTHWVTGDNKGGYTNFEFYPRIFDEKATNPVRLSSIWLKGRDGDPTNPSLMLSTIALSVFDGTTLLTQSDSKPISTYTYVRYDFDDVLELDPNKKYTISSENQMHICVRPSTSEDFKIIGQNWKPVIRAEVGIETSDPIVQENELFASEDAIDYQISAREHLSYDRFGGCCAMLIDTNSFLNNNGVRFVPKLMNRISIQLQPGEIPESGSIYANVFKFAGDYEEAQTYLSNHYDLNSDIPSTEAATDKFKKICTSTYTVDGEFGRFDLVDSSGNPTSIRYKSDEIYLMRFSKDIACKCCQYPEFDRSAIFWNSGSVKQLELMISDNNYQTRKDPVFSLDYVEHDSELAGRKFRKTIVSIIQSII